MTRLDSGRPGRITLGLLNTYDRRVLREPHRRAIARAGAVAAAFDCNLALFAFPMPQGVGTALELAEWSSAKTTIGQDAAYFVTLAKAGRADLFPEPKGSFPPQLGTAVATTSKPRLPKTLTIARLADRVRGGESVMLVFGLGPHGLPDEARRACAVDFDVTEAGYSLETATAIGAVTAVLWYASRRTPEPLAR
ncbi:MAG TPA: DUF531 family protein [Candidatus Thermoplasmatota archaeon]|nr:DUF531 family protein [Candidatus Thermoplasmatota archaeon]